MRTLYQSISAHAKRTPQASAILAPHREPLSYGTLLQQIDYVGQYLNDRGIGRDDRIAVVLDNGPELASALVGVMSYAAAVPLNPDYTEPEWQTVFTDLRINALVAAAAAGTTARSVARRLGITVLELQPQQAAGRFSLSGGAAASCNCPGIAAADDLALVLRSSATTATAKIIPVRHGNLAARMQQTVHALTLTPADRCLNIMPYFHSHGLGNGLYGPLATGASIVCLTGFAVDQFAYCLRFLRPSYYSAGYTHQQAILAWADGHHELISGHGLRFIRSASGHLPTAVQSRLEQVFGVPVIQGYGSTETGTIATNPLPPRKRKPDTVGVTGLSQVAIMDESGERRPNGEPGEVWVRGPGVIAAYENNPELNKTAFHKGWFRTGDLGYFDADGYLTLCGRLKEMINRGGQKIAPAEIDQVLLSHPDVVETGAFAIPHRTLGETVAAAVVTRSRSTLSEKALKEFLSTRLSGFKIPEKLIISADALPKTDSGKLQRNKLAEYFGLHQPPVPQPEPVSAANILLQQLTIIWQSILELEQPPGIHDDFIELGGNSLLSALLVETIEERLQIKLAVEQLHRIKTIDQLAVLIRHSEGNQKTTIKSSLADDIYHKLLAYTVSWEGMKATPGSLITGLNTAGSHQPLYWCFQGYNEFMQLARNLGPEQPVYGMRSGHLAMAYSSDSIRALARHYVDEILALQSQGSYLIGGNCQAVWISTEIARQLQARGKTVSLLILLESFRLDPAHRAVNYFYTVPVKKDRKSPPSPQPYSGRVALLFGQDSHLNPYRYFHDPQPGWRSLYPGGYSVDIVPGRHGHFFTEPYVQGFSACLQKCLRRVRDIPPHADVTAHSLLPETAYQAKLHTRQSLRAQPSQMLRLAVVVQNCSQVAWPMAKYNSGIYLNNIYLNSIYLINHWHSDSGELLVWKDGGVPLAKGLAPGQSETVVLTVVTPQQPGCYRLELELAVQGIDWFHDRGCDSTWIKAEVSVH